MLAGCYATYSGIYFLDRAERPQSVTFGDLSSQIADVLKPFGFRKIQLPKEMDDLGPSFSHHAQYGNKDLMVLSGAGARISVVISFRGPSITIRDMDHDKETEFVKAIRDAIEQRLEEHYRLKGLRFERQVDILV